MSHFLGRGRRTAGLVLFIPAFVMLLGLCIQPPAARALTYEEEKVMGREVLAMVRKRMKMVEDPVITSYVNSLGQRLLQAVGSQPFEYRFYVVDSPVINAFAVPGGQVFIHTETIAAMRSEGQLAAILSHEIAHVTSRHVAKRMEKGKALSLAALGGILAGILLGGQAGGAVMLGTVAGTVQAQLAYSREDEQEADNRGLDYLVKAGYDPRFMAKAFETMIQANPAAPKDVPTYLVTHPALSERVNSVESAVKAHPGFGRVTGQGDDKAFLAVQDRLIALLTDPTRARNHFNAALKKNPADPGGHYGLALLAQREQDQETALREFRIAMKGDPANANYMADLGALLFLRRDTKGALEQLNRAKILKPNSPRVLFLLGWVYEDTGAIDQAIEYFERVVVQQPDDAQAHYHLGLVYGAKGDMVQAHLHTGLSFKIEFKYDKALFHLNKAKESAAKAPPDVKERIEAALRDIDREKKKPN